MIGNKSRKLHARMPLGVWYAIVCLALLFALSAFRMPPLSISASNTYFELDGSKTAEILSNTPERIERTITSGGHTTIINADVYVPDNRQISVFKASNAKVDYDKAIKTLYPDDTQFSYEDSIEIHAALYYDLTYQEVMGETSFFEKIENGRLDFYFYGDETIDSADEALAFVQKAGLAPGATQVFYRRAEGDYVIRPVVDGMPVSHSDSFDAYRKSVNSSGSLVLAMNDKQPARLKGNFFQPTQVLWESTEIISVEEAIKALTQKQMSNAEITEIRLVYQARSILANPFEVILIPMWEFRIKDDFDLVCLVNAVNGIVERYVYRE